MSLIRPVAGVAPALLLLLLVAPPVGASLIDDEVMGTLNFEGIPGNFFEPDTAVVAANAIEFSFSDFVNIITVDLDAETITLEASPDEFSSGVIGAFDVWLDDLEWTDFESGVITGYEILENTFGGLISVETMDHSVHFSFAGLSSGFEDTLLIDIELEVLHDAPVPEPALSLLAATGLLSLCLGLRRRGRA